MDFWQRVTTVTRRTLDVVVGLLMLLCGAPLYLAAALAVWSSMGGPVLFSQTRVGRYGNEFLLYKFRTMNNNVDARGVLLPDNARLTRVGQILRATSVDELPQALNLLKGEMSLIGPRPLLVRYLPRYTPEQMRRHDVRPGITGWAQVNGRNTISWEEKFRYDVWYVDNQSLKLDVIIIARTIGKVLFRSGVSAQGHVTMPEFMGSNDE